MDFVFEFPLGWQAGLPLVCVALALAAWFLWRRGVAPVHLAALMVLRGLFLLSLVFLVARPNWVERDLSAGVSKSIALLMDRSESMSLQEDGQTRYQRALSLLRDRLIPAVKKTHWQI